jgi:uncharacterized protein (TIRG00374 family)
MERKNLIKTLLALLVTIIALYYLFLQVNVTQVVNFIFGLQLGPIIIAFLIYVLSLALRAFRFWILLKKKISYLSILRISIYHTFFTSVMPSVTGEISYVYLVDKTGKISLRENVASLLVARIFDFIAFYLVMLISLFFIRDIEGPLAVLVLICMIILTAATGGFVLFLAFNEKFISLCKRIVVWVRFNKVPLLKKMFDRLFDLMEEISHVRSPFILLFNIIVSILVWIFSALCSYYLFIATGFTFPYFKIFFASSFLRFISNLPIQGIAGFGTGELSVAFVFNALGLNLDKSILTGFAVHILSLAFIVILAGALLLFELTTHKKS